MQMLEPLESRRLLSANFAESEPNNSASRADALPRVLGETIEVRGRVKTLGDHDWFEINLKAGDVLGVAVTGGEYDVGGLDPYARLLDASGKLVIENAGPSFNAGDYLPDESPLPRGDRGSLSVEFYRVMPKAGTYYLDVSSYFGESSGSYRMDVRVARPGMEAAPRGTKQVLFLDFDGATVDYADFRGDPPSIDRATLSPMRNSLEGFNLSLDDESSVIDAVVNRVKKLLSSDIERNGLNGDYDRSRRAGEFDLEIRNSRDHRDTYGKDPFVSRVVIGGTNEESGLGGASGLAESQDIGNFKTDDQAVATLQWLTDAVDFISAAPPLTQIDLFADAIATITAHEAAHIFGAVHTDVDPEDNATGISQIMDPFLGDAIGPDLVFGTDDDLKAVFGVDGYYEGDFFAGVNDTLNTLAFGLSTGMGRSRHGGDDDDHADCWNRRSFAASGRVSDTAWKQLESMDKQNGEPL